MLSKEVRHLLLRIALALDPLLETGEDLLCELELLERGRRRSAATRAQALCEKSRGEETRATVGIRGHGSSLETRCAFCQWGRRRGDDELPGQRVPDGDPEPPEHERDLEEPAHRGQRSEGRQREQELRDDSEERARGGPPMPAARSSASLCARRVMNSVRRARMIDASVVAARTWSSSDAAAVCPTAESAAWITGFYFLLQPRISTAPFPLRSFWSRRTVSVCAGRSRSSPLVSPRLFNKS